MIVVIKTVTEEHGDYGEYRKVEGIDGNGKPVTKNVGDRFQDKWSMLRENATVEFKMIQKNNKWVINDILSVDSPPPTTPVQPPPHIDEPTPEELEELNAVLPGSCIPKFQVDGRTHDIHRQVALKCATDLASHGLIKLSELKEKSDMLLKYLDGE